MNKFFPLAVTSKFGICGCPVRADTYVICSHRCQYCFASEKVCGGKHGDIPQEVGDSEALDKYLSKVLSPDFDPKNNFLDKLVHDNMFFHLGANSDPLQPCEGTLHATRDFINVTNRHNRHVVVSTKGASLFNINFRPDLQSFQFSISNVRNHSIEKGLRPIEERLALFRYLKKEGFRVGIRIQPFIPDISSLDIVRMFEGADHYQLEGIKLIPQNKGSIDNLLTLTNLTIDDFVMMGHYNLNPELRLKHYQPFIDYFKEHNLSWSVADNDLHYMGNNQCCCGDTVTFGMYSHYNNTYMFHKYGKNYTKENLLQEADSAGILDCRTSELFLSNRKEGKETAREYFNTVFYKKSAPASPLFQYYRKSNLLDLF